MTAAGVVSPRRAGSGWAGTGWAAGTVSARRHLGLARALARSFRRQHPDVPFVVLLADDEDAAFPDAAGAQRAAFLQWARIHGAREYGIAAELLPEA
jgi:hypothetical protein